MARMHEKETAKMDDKNGSLESGLNKMTHHEVAVWRVAVDATLPNEIRLKAMRLLAELLEHGTPRP